MSDRDPITGMIPPEFRVLTMSEAELEQIVRAGVKQGVEETFLTTGIDVSTPEAVIQVQRDFQYMRRLRRTAENVQKWSTKVVVTTIVAAMLAAVWAGFGESIRRFFH